jgi:hypothetical protein
MIIPGDDLARVDDVLHSAFPFASLYFAVVLKDCAIL